MKKLTYFAFLLLALTQVAFAKNLLISVGDLKENDVKYLRETCDKIFKVANQVSQDAINITCHKSDTSSFSDPYISKARSSNDYFLRVFRTKDNQLDLEAQNWSGRDEEDFKTLSWTFKDATKSNLSKEDALLKSISNFIFYIENEKAFKVGLMMNAISESKDVSFDESNGEFRENLTGEKISAERAYKLFSKESDRKLNYLRSGIEIGVLLSAGMAIYYKNLVYNKQDFDYGFRDGLKAKFVTGEAIRFDDNDKFANYGHAFAGVLYHQVARANGFNAMESFLITFASSAMWEVLEYHEVFSINDQIVTPIGGYIIGEAMYQTSCALIAKGTLGAKTLGYSLSPMLASNHAIDRFSNDKDKWKGQPDCKKPRWSDISLKLGLEQGQKPYEHKANNDFFVALDSTVINIPEYGKAGKAQGLVYDTAMSKLNIEVNGNDGLLDLRVVAEVVAAAYYNRNIGVDNKGELKGYEFSLGLGSAATWNDRGHRDSEYRPDTKEDFFGTINIIGATAFADIHYKGAKIRAEFGFYGDFTMVKSYALEQLRDAEGLEGQPTVIGKRGYYWGTGTTTLAGISVEKGKFKVGYDMQSSNAKIIHGKGRNQELVTREDDYRDELKIDRFFIRYSLTKNLSLELAREYVHRSGSINNTYAKSGTEKRTRATLNYQF